MTQVRDIPDAGGTDDGGEHFEEFHHTTDTGGDSPEFLEFRSAPQTRAFAGRLESCCRGVFGGYDDFRNPRQRLSVSAIHSE